MDKSFYIKRIYAYGVEKAKACIELTNGLNIICGPSNTGKSYIIEIISYVLGGENISIDKKLGYDTVAIDIITNDNYEVHVKRKIGDSETEFQSNDPNIGNIKLNLKKSRALFLKMIGIKDSCRIVSKKDYTPQNLSWRNIINISLIDDERISNPRSLLFSTKYLNTTGALSTLLYLFDGVDRTIDSDGESKKIRDAKRKAVSEYINQRIAKMDERNYELCGLSPEEEKEKIKLDILSKTKELYEYNDRIIKETNKNQNNLKIIYELSSEISKGLMLVDRYSKLESQYKADIERLHLIIDGEKKLPKIQISKCPICDSSIKMVNSVSYIKSSEMEIKRIERLLAELTETENALLTEIDSNQKELEKLKKENVELNILINEDLMPKKLLLNKKIQELQYALHIQNEIEFIQNLKKEMKEDIEEILNEEDSKKEFNVTDYFDDKVIGLINRYLDESFKHCKFPNYINSTLNIKTFDVVINGRDKKDEGKGYRSFINTIFAFVLMKYMSINAKHALKLLVIDSPIRSLSEKEDVNSELNGVECDVMKKGLFDLFVNNQEFGQVIIVENIIPDIDYKDANIIKFTKDETNGRYGFLDHKD